VEDLRGTQCGESAGSWHSPEKPACSRGSTGESAQKRVNLPQAPRSAILVRIRDAGEAQHRRAHPANMLRSYLGMTRLTREPIDAPARRMDRADRRITLLP
jgi:hypothetical protein